MTAPLGTPLGWQRVRDVFHAALERDPGTRGDYLEQACEGDADLRREVDSLIAAHGQVGSFIGEPVGTPEHPPSSPIPRRPSLPAGSKIGPYELAELLGAGGMGEVYRARDPRLGREVALKILPPDLARDPARRERFLREARMVSALNHPNICTIHEIGTAGGLDYICFEYIEGQTLAVLLEGPALSFARFLELSLPLAQALVYAHEKGILHRDLKPSNIIVSERGPKILDFGLAKSLTVAESEPGSTTSLSSAGLVMGTAAYMSPEQALGRPVDERSDIFSLGAVLYEMASGKRAFVGNTPTEVMDAVLHLDPIPLAQSRPEIPAVLSLVVTKAIRKNAAERYQTMADLAADVRRLGDPDGRRMIATASRRIARMGILAVVAMSILIGVLSVDHWHAGPSPVAPNSLAVMYFENLSDPTDVDNLGRMLTGLLATDLAGSQDFQVVSSQRLYDITRQIGNPESSPDRSMATDAARRAGAAKMVLGQVTRAGLRIVATAELVDVESGRRLGTYRAEGSSLNDVFSIAEGLGAHLRAKVTGHPRLPGAGGPLIRQLTASADAYRAYVRGEALLHRWELDKAAEEFRQATSIDPEFALAYYRFSIAAAFSGQARQEARAAAERAAVLKEKLPPWARDLVEGNVLYVTGRLSQAVPVLESALARNPEDKEALLLLSECYTISPRDADPGRAAELMERLLALDPESHLVYRRLSVNYALLGEFERARSRIDDWEGKEPETARLVRSQVSAYAGDLDEALRLSESTDGRTGVFWRGLQALAAGRWEVVRSILREHAGEGDLGTSLKWVQAHLHVLLGDFDRAEADYRGTLPARLEPDEGLWAAMTAGQLQALAELLALKGDVNGARREAERALLIQPEGPYCLYFAGIFAIRAGDIAVAEERLRTLEAVVRTAHGPLVPHYRDALQAEVALARGRPLDARPLLEKALASGTVRYDGWKFEPGTAFRDGLARTYLALGERKKAASVIETTVASGFERVTHPVPYVQALYTLGTLRLDLGDEPRGRELLRKFLTHWGRADWDIREVRAARARLAASSR
jgi:tetratricopeptide (TPR) repeat protein